MEQSTNWRRFRLDHKFRLEHQARIGFTQKGARQCGRNGNITRNRCLVSPILRRTKQKRVCMSAHMSVRPNVSPSVWNTWFTLLIGYYGGVLEYLMSCIWEGPSYSRFNDTSIRIVTFQSRFHCYPFHPLIIILKMFSIEIGQGETKTKLVVGLRQRMHEGGWWLLFQRELLHEPMRLVLL